MGCQDGAQDYEPAQGTCAQPPAGFGYYLTLSVGDLPLPVCARRVDPTAALDFVILDVDKG